MTDTEKKSNRGRPSTDTEPVNLRLPRTMIQELDRRRKMEADLPSRPEMIRRLLQDLLRGS
ncbi:ribbon-helix-helix protein, CopG family [Albidovulum sp.]|uniref:ribbon-helix-helix protein, CopG family n=1 Tax=Albidovulum sp. TaxID=1872424 RepID=UPI0039B98411